MRKMLVGVAVLAAAFAMVPAALADGFSFNNGNNQIAWGDLNVGQNGDITGGTINFDGGTYTLFTNGGDPQLGSNSNLNGDLFFDCGGQTYQLSNNDIECLRQQGNNWSGNFNCGGDPNPSPTPEPASLLLLGTGVLALAGLAKLKLA